MRKYETVLISDPDLSDQARTELLDKVGNIITKEQGMILDLDDWGNKKLAYEIKKKSRGHYVCVTYGGTGALVAELERNFRLSDDVLKFMTIVLSEDLTKEALEQEADALQEKRAQESQASEAQAAESKDAQDDSAEPEAAASGEDATDAAAEETEAQPAEPEATKAAEPATEEADTAAPADGDETPAEKPEKETEA